MGEAEAKRGSREPEPDPGDAEAPPISGLEASLIVVAGSGRGEEHRVTRARCLIGRGPGVDLSFDDPEMSERHSAIEFRDGRFRIVDLDSTNGTEINGTAVACGEVGHGDRIRIGRHVLQLLIERRDERRWSA